MNKHITAIYNHIVFQFIDRVNTKGMFEEASTSGGILLIADHQKSANQARWAKIISLGPDCSNVLREEGCEILIEALRWSPGIKYNDEFLWRTDESQLLGYRYPEDLSSIGG